MREKLKRALFILSALSLFVFSLSFVDEAPSSVNEGQPKTHFLPKVSYIAVAAAEQQISVVAFGELKPKWDVILKAQVNGAINFIDPLFEPGSLVTAQKVLMHIEDSFYISEKVTAEVRLAEAKLQLVQAKKKTELADKDWKRSGINKLPSELALFKPQLKIAEKALESAHQQLSVAINKSSHTRIKTPFKGIIIERMVGLGQQVYEGEPLLRLIDHQNLHLSVFLSEIQWQNLSDHWLNSQVQLFSSMGDFIAMATIVRGGHYLDKETRQYSLFLDLNSEQNRTAVSGQFVQVSVPGKKLKNYLSLPESALTREGIIWFIDQQDTLRSYNPKNIFYQNKRVLVPEPDKNDRQGQAVWQVATTPLGSFLAGKKVDPTELKKEN
ncbi:MAG: RND family efflux transporter MFP subunit [Oleiphilaceae bacterium]|jgi:RND family efflux transporter MFP subunit